MFITRKKYEEAIERAKNEVLDRVYQEERLSNFSADVSRRLEDMERRLFEIERHTGMRDGRTSLGPEVKAGY